MLIGFAANTGGTQGVHRVERPSLSSLASPVDAENSSFMCFLHWSFAGSMTHRVDGYDRVALSGVLLIVTPKVITVACCCSDNVGNFSSIHSLAVTSTRGDLVVFQHRR